MSKDCELSECKWCASSGSCMKEDSSELVESSCDSSSSKSCFETKS